MDGRPNRMLRFQSLSCVEWPCGLQSCSIQTVRHGVTDKDFSYNFVYACTNRQQLHTDLISLPYRLIAIYWGV